MKSLTSGKGKEQNKRPSVSVASTGRAIADQGFAPSEIKIISKTIPFNHFREVNLANSAPPKPLTTNQVSDYSINIPLNLTSYLFYLISKIVSCKLDLVVPYWMRYPLLYVIDRFLQIICPRSSVWLIFFTDLGFDTKLRN